MALRNQSWHDPWKPDYAQAPQDYSWSQCTAGEGGCAVTIAFHAGFS